MEEVNSSIYESVDVIKDQGKYEDLAEFSRPHIPENPEYQKLFTSNDLGRNENGEMEPTLGNQERLHQVSTLRWNYSDESSRWLVDEQEDIYKKISQIPEELSELTVDDVGHVLKCLHMEGYVKIFEEEMVDGPILKDLDLESLQSLNVTFFHAKKLLKFVNGWRPRKGQQI